MNAEGATELRRLISMVQIENVRLIEGASSTRISIDEMKPSEFTANHLTAVLGGLRENGTFTVLAKLEAQVTTTQEAGDSIEPIMRFLVVHELRYRVPVGEVFTDQTLAEFAQVNGVFNAWPYWREFVQNHTARMGLPPLVMPVFRGSQPKRDLPVATQTNSAAAAVNAPESAVATRKLSRKRATRKRR